MCVELRSLNLPLFFIIMLAQVYERASLDCASYNCDIWNVIVETEARRKNSLFSRLPAEIIRYLKPFVRYALCPRVRYAVVGDLVYPNIPIKRTIGAATFAKCMGWDSNRVDDLHFICDVRYYSTYDNCRGMRFSFRSDGEENAYSTADKYYIMVLNAMLAVSASSIGMLTERISITISWRYLEGSSTCVDIRMKPPLGESSWADKRDMHNSLFERARALRAMDQKKRKPQTHYMKNFKIRKF